MKNIIGGGLAASILALGVSAGASGAAVPNTSNEPIVITSVAHMVGERREGVPPFIVIGFTNENAVPAKVVVFHVTNTSGEQTEIRDVGTFAKGAAIRHAFAVPGITGGSAEVIEAQFADGSVWERHAPVTPALPQAAQ